MAEPVKRVGCVCIVGFVLICFIVCWMFKMFFVAFDSFGDFVDYMIFKIRFGCLDCLYVWLISGMPQTQRSAQ